MTHYDRKLIEEFEVDGVLFRYECAPHLQENEDWHTAYRSKIQSIFERNQLGRVSIPQYPLLNQEPQESERLIFEVGAYWEGAIYYLESILRQDDLLKAVNKVLIAPSTPLPDIRWKIFAAIWNNVRQLEWLKAFLVREYTNFLWGAGIDYWNTSEEIRRTAVTSPHEAEVRWLAEFVELHERERETLTNPYFGGSNPLHLSFYLLPLNTHSSHFGH